MPTCRLCGRVGVNHVCRKPQAGSCRSGSPKKAWAAQKQDLQEDLKAVGEDLGELLLAEEIMDAQDGKLSSLAHKARRETVEAARSQLYVQIQALHADVRRTVLGDQVWRRTGTPPEFFSKIGLASEPAVSSEATQTDTIEKPLKWIARTKDASAMGLTATAKAPPTPDLKPPPVCESPTKRAGVTFASAAELEQRRRMRTEFSPPPHSSPPPPTAHTAAHHFERMQLRTSSDYLLRRAQSSEWTAAAAARWSGASVRRPSVPRSRPAAGAVSASLAASMPQTSPQTRLEALLALKRAEARQLEAVEPGTAAVAWQEAKLLQTELTKLLATPIASRVRRLRDEAEAAAPLSTAALSSPLDLGSGARYGAKPVARPLLDRARVLKHWLKTSTEPGAELANDNEDEDEDEDEDASIDGRPPKPLPSPASTEERNGAPSVVTTVAGPVSGLSPVPPHLLPPTVAMPMPTPPQRTSAGPGQVLAAAHWAAIAQNHTMPISSLPPSYVPPPPAASHAASQPISPPPVGSWQLPAAPPVLPAAAAAAAWAAAHPPSFTTAPAADSAVHATAASRQAAAATSSAVHRFSAAYAHSNSVAAHADLAKSNHAAAPSAAAASAHLTSAPFQPPARSTGAPSAPFAAPFAAAPSDTSDVEADACGGTPSTGGSWQPATRRARHTPSSATERPSYPPLLLPTSYEYPAHAALELGVCSRAIQLPTTACPEALIDAWLVRARHRAYDAKTFDPCQGTHHPMLGGVAGAHAAIYAGLQQAQQILAAFPDAAKE